jgi:hypothetical protein
VPLQYYDGTHTTLGPWAGTNAVYGATTQVGGLALVENTRTALYVGRNGLGPFCYGEGTGDQSLAGIATPDGGVWCYDPTSSDKGQHAYPYQYQVWAFDLADWASVKAGLKQPWEPVPYATWTLGLPTTDPSWRGIGGVGYDPATQLLYVAQLRADPDGYASRPIIHVFHIQ